MNVLVIDAQGGGIGKQLIASIKHNCPKIHITAVGTNSTATSAMLKAGADEAATGQNAVCVCTKKADIIIGPIGIVIANAMIGEITPAMAVAVGSSSAKKLLIPVNQCDNIVVGMDKIAITKLIDEVVNYLTNL